MNWDRLIDLLDINVNDSKGTFAGTVATILSVCYAVYTVLGEVVIPALQQLQGFVGN